MRMGGSFFFSSRRRHTRLQGDWSSDVCSSDLGFLQDVGSWTPREHRVRCGARDVFAEDRAKVDIVGPKLVERWVAGGPASARLGERIRSIGAESDRPNDLGPM